MRTSLLGRFLIAAAIATAPSAVSAETVSNQVAPAAANSSIPAGTAAKPADAEKKICKILPSSYSHASDRVCLTKSEWQQVEAQD